MAKTSNLAGTTIGLMIDQCLRDLAYCCDLDAVVRYGAMATGVDKEELRRIILAKRSTFSQLYADH